MVHLQIVQHLLVGAMGIAHCPIGIAFLGDLCVLFPCLFQPMTPMTPSQEGLNGEELKELVEAGPQTAIPPSPDGASLKPCELFGYSN